MLERCSLGVLDRGFSTGNVSGIFHTTEGEC